MATVALRIFVYSLLPLIIAAGHVRLDKTAQSRERGLEIFLLYLFGVGVAGSGIGGFSVTSSVPNRWPNPWIKPTDEV
jgi:hypothetical protein